jgi:hypothetical protein
MPRSDGCVYSSLEVEVGQLSAGDQFRLDGRSFVVKINDGQRYLVVDEIGHTNTVHLDSETLVWPKD